MSESEGQGLSKDSREKFFLVSSSFWWPQIFFVFWSLSLHGLLCLSVSVWPSLKNFGPIVIQHDFFLTELTASTNTLFPNKVTF